MSTIPPVRSRFRAARLRATAAALLAIGLPVLLVGGCTDVFKREERRPCPPVRLEASTAEMTRFRAGPGRDLTDVVMEAEITGFQGACQYADEGDSVEIELVLGFAASLGPGADSRTQTFRYFVAVPRFFPDPAGKKVFETTLTFPDGIDRVRYGGEELTITVPVDPAEGAMAMPVYIGFQLTEEQIEFNRTQRSGSLP